MLGTSSAIIRRSRTGMGLVEINIGSKLRFKV
jgi:hypothetical protein